MKRKLFGSMAVLLVLTMLLSACGGSSSSQAAGDAGTAASTAAGSTAAGSAAGSSSGRTDLNIGMIGEPKTMDPTQVSDLTTSIVLYQIYDTLIRNTAEGELIPWLAESWEFNEDGTEVTFHLRDDVTFWNGDPMTADDVVGSYTRAMESPFCTSYTSCMESMEKIDDYTCKLTLKFPYPAVTNYVTQPALSILSQKHYDEVGAEGYARNPMGTGAYKYVNWASGDSIDLEVNENYWAGEPAIKSIHAKFFTDGSTAVVALQKGEVDFVDTPPKADRQSLLDDPNIEYYETEISSCVYVAFNNAREPFNDERVRRAIMMAIDKEAMVEGAVEGLGTPQHTYWYTKVGGWDDSVPVEPLPYDPEAAKALLAEAGYPDGMDITLYTTDSATYSKPTEVLQYMLSQIGVNAEIVKEERTTFFDRLQSQRDYEISICATTTSPDLDYIYTTFHSSALDPTTGRNFMNVDDPEVDRLLEEGRAEMDEAKRSEIYHELADLMNEKAYVGPLYTYMTPIAANKDLQGVVINSLNRWYAMDFSWA